MDPVLLELLKPLGVAAPLVGVLWWLLQRSDAERRDTTGQYTSALKEIVQQNIETQTQLRDSLREVAQSCRDSREQHSSEHQRIGDRLTSIEMRLAANPQDGGRRG